MHDPMIAFSCDDVSPKTNVNKLKELLRTADGFDINVTLFAIPKNEEKWNSCASLVRVLKDARGRGHEIGLHGLSHFPFETGNPFGVLSPGCPSIRQRILKGLRIFNERLELNPRGFRAPYYHFSRSLLKVLDDLGFLYDSSKIALTSVFLSYVPPLRAICVFKKGGHVRSRIFHPLHSKLLEIPISQEYTWYNLKFEVGSFETFLKKGVSRTEGDCLVINSHIAALSSWGVHIIKQLFLRVKEMGIYDLTLRKMAEKTVDFEATKAYYV